jgi:hypothetical protein
VNGRPKSAARIQKVTVSSHIGGCWLNVSCHRWVRIGSGPAISLLDGFRPFRGIKSCISEGFCGRSLDRRRGWWVVARGILLFVGSCKLGVQTMGWIFVKQLARDIGPKFV